MCLNPKTVRKKGHYKENTYRGWKGEYYELTTYSKCGSCSQCINEKANNWVVRNYYESKINQKKCFITLTYRDNPIIIVKKDLQDFMKRLRINLKRSGYEKKIRMYGCMEYGERFGRPHAHVIIYGWEDENAKYLGINGRKNLYYESEMIKKSWGLGRTSYQKFDQHEVPYISLYETPKENFKKAYKMTREKAKKLSEMSKNHFISNRQRRNFLDELSEINKKLKDEKIKYMLIKEFNTWSIALGWKQFEKEYYEKNNYAWEEYIEDKIFVTPTPWIKKLANVGDVAAAQEMFRREEMIIQSANENEEKRNNEIKAAERLKKERKKLYEEKLEQTKNGAKTIF